MLYTTDMRITLRTVVAILMLCSVSSVSAFTDTQGYRFTTSIETLRSHGVVQGYGDGTFRPNAPINRAEFLKMTMLASLGDQTYGNVERRCFTDFFGPTEKWFWIHACRAKQLGIVNGHPDGTFRGTDTVILAEALKMAMEAWQVPVAHDPGLAWYEPYMLKAAELGLFQHLPFTATYQLTRGEMSKILTQLDQPIAYVGIDPPEDDPTTVDVIYRQPPVCGNGYTEQGEQCDDGNTLDGDGCSSICVIVSEPIRHGALRIEQRSMGSTDRTSGSEDISLLAFDAIAGRQDVYITTLKFRSAQGSLSNATDYTLLIDRDGDGEVESLFGRAVPSGETLTFGNLNILVRDGAYTRVELRANLQNLHSNHSVAVEFDTSDPAFVEGVDKIDGEDVTGIQLNDQDCQLESICWIAVLTEDARVVSIAGKGNLFVTDDNSSVPELQLLASTLTETVLKLEFEADEEDIVVKELAIDNVPDAVDFLEYYTEGSSSPFATGKAVDCDSIQNERMCMNGEFTVPRSGRKTIEIRAFLHSDSQTDSGDSLQLKLDAGASVAAIEAQGYYSGQNLLENNGDSSEDGEIFIGRDNAGPDQDITGVKHKIYLAALEDITDIHTDNDGDSVPAGSNTIAAFRFEAKGHSNDDDGLNTLTLKRLRFTVNASNVEFESGSFYLYNMNNTAVTEACSASATTGNITVTCNGLQNSEVDTFISEADDIDLALQAVVSSAQVSPGVSVLQVSLQSLSNPNHTGIVEWTDGDSNVDWIDIGKTQVRSTAYRLD